MRLSVPVLLASLTAVLASLLPAQETAPLSEDEKVLHALSRLAFGHRPGEVERIRALGLKGWIQAQLHPEKLAEPALAAQPRVYETLDLTPQAVYDLIEAPAAERPKTKSAAGLPYNQNLGPQELARVIIERSTLAEGQLREVLTDFWRNHFNVDLGKGQIYYSAMHYEQTVIRPHVYGRFEDMLFASARHPAMLVYLDNAVSRKPPPKSVLRRIEREARKKTGSRELAEQQVRLAEQRGLNENYARELMELHTLGVDNGYTQRDVMEVAKAFTGWTVDRASSETWFCYKDDMHCEGPKYLMGLPLPRGRRDTGVVEGEAVLKHLANHRNTAEFIARKLCVRLVNDRPPAAIVKEAARRFRQSKGDLRVVTEAIVTHPAFFDRAHYRAKFKTPLEFVISAIRASGATLRDAGVVAGSLKELGEELYRFEDPTGYSDTAESWRDPGVMALRWKIAMELARGSYGGARIPDAFFAGLPEDPLEMIDQIALRILPQGLGQATRAVLERALFRQVQKGEGSDQEALARTITGILLGCPEFQLQ